MPKESRLESVSTENKRASLGYMREFRTSLKEHPGIVGVAKKLMDQAISVYNPQPRHGMCYDKDTARWMTRKQNIIGKDSAGRPIIEPGPWMPMEYGRKTMLVPGEAISDPATGLVVTLLGRSNRENLGTFDRKDTCDYFKVTLKGKSYFVKRSLVSTNPGYTEFQNNQRAQEILGKFDFVTIVKAQLGYQGEGESWFVSDWKDLEGSGFSPVSKKMEFDDYGNTKDWTADAEIYADHIKQELYRALKSENLGADLGANLFYNPKTGKFILVDVTSTDILDKRNQFGDPIKNKEALNTLASKSGRQPS